MIISKRAGISALLVAAVLLAIIFAPSISASTNTTKSEKALEYISQKHGLPKERLKITNEKEANFPLSNQKIWSVNILDPKGKEFYYVDLDEAGNTVDIKAAKALEHAKYREKYGKKEIALHEKLQKMNPDDMVEVGIWLSPVATPPFPEREISEQEYKAILDAKRKAYAEKEKPVLDILKAKNITIRYASQLAPLIYAQVTVKLMAEVENIPEVEGIYLARECKPSLYVVNQTVRVQPMWNAGVTGSGIKVAVVERGAINFSNPWLKKPGSYANPPGSPWYTETPHAINVAGIIASTHPTYQGISYGVPALLSANIGQGGDPLQEESRAINASEWAIINQSADILSNSWYNNYDGIMNGLDKYFDHVVWQNRKTVIVAAGNYVVGETRNVKSPGLGFNVISVGGFVDMNDSDWSNDVIWNDSNYIDPISPYGDREKPEVAAVATHGDNNYIWSLHPADPWIKNQTGAGTSFAAPQVAAEAALLMQADPSLIQKPEVIKAIIMASAVHNIEGDSRLSDKDGAGGIDISTAYETRTAASNVSASSYPQHFTFSATAGQKIRAVITWDSHPDNNSPPVSDELQSDLNLVVYSPSGAVVGTPSDSFDNSYEIVEFTASETGTYDAQVQARTYSGSEIIGFAKTVVALPGWDYRKNLTIIGTTAGAQTNYQMKLTVYKASGTDTPGVVYLGGNVKDDFSDLRFTRSDGVTLLDYWIESYTSGVSAVVWVEVDSIPASPGTADIYLYYGNPSATSVSNGKNTFLAYGGLNDFTEYDPNNNIQKDNDTQLSITDGIANTGYMYESASEPVNGFVLDFDVKSLSPKYGSGNFPYCLGINDRAGLRGYGGYGVPDNDGHGVYMCWHIDGFWRLVYNNLGTYSGSSDMSVYRDTWYYMCAVRNGSTTTFYIYNDAAKTSLKNSKSLDTGTAAFTYLHAVVPWSSREVALEDADLKNYILRKYTSPEPGWST